MRILKQPLVLRVADQLKEHIHQGEWNELLPSEIHLAKDLGVSRTTLRQALGLLREEGLIETHQGKNTRVKKKNSATKNHLIESPTVAMLSPAPLSQLRQHTLLWIDELRGLLHEAHLSLHVHADLNAFRGNPVLEVEKLIQQYRSSVWILFWSQSHTQQAFASLNIPTVVVGAAEKHIPLNTASVDNAAIAYHAIGQLTSRGHRSLALVTSNNPTTGNQLIEDGFTEGLNRKARQGIRGQVIYTEEKEPEKLKRSLLRSLGQKQPPTGFLFVHPLYLLTAYNAFQGAGYSIPEDVSLMSAFADQAFDYLTPKPAYYRMDPEAYAEKLFNLICKLREGIATSSDSFNLIPDLVEGKSIGHSRP